jgi:hypothetical protein
MNKIEVTVEGTIISACYKKVEETDAWIAQCESEELWGRVGTYTIKITDATAELEIIRSQKELVSKNTFKNSFQNNSEITFNFVEPQNTVTASLTSSGVQEGTYNNVTVDSKGRVTLGFNSDVINRISYVTTINQVNSSSTYATVSGLTSVSLPAGLYKIIFIGAMQSGATQSGVGVRVSPVTATISNIYIKWFISLTATTNSQYEQMATTTNLTSASVATANSNFSVTGEGIIRITGQGTVAIQIRPETNGTAATIRPDSIFLLEKIL